MTLTRVFIPSPNFSAGRTQSRLLVIHSAEGALTYQALGAFFANPAAQVSSHVGIDDSDSIGEYVKPDRMSWTAFAGNQWGLHAELCGFAAWSRAQWLEHPTMLVNTAEWLAEEAARYAIPLVKVGAADIIAGKSGICGHVDLTQAGAGGNHWDPGPGFPWDVILERLRAAPVTTPVTAPAPAPAPPAPPVSQVPPFPGTCQQGSTGAAVRAFQSRLAARGWPLVVDGSFGPATRAVVVAFQREKGLVVDGIAGNATWSALWLAAIT